MSVCESVLLWPYLLTQLSSLDHETQLYLGGNKVWDFLCFGRVLKCALRFLPCRGKQTSNNNLLGFNLTLRKREIKL